MAYEIPWKPLDLSPALAMLTAARNQRAANDRADAEAEFRREQAGKENYRADYYARLAGEDRRLSAQRHSAEVERQKNRDKEQRDKEAFEKIPTLMRAAASSFKQTGAPGYVATNPYGVSFDVTSDLPTNVEGPELSPQAEAARFAPKPQAAVEPQPVPADPIDYTRQHAPSPASTGYRGGGMDAFGDEQRQIAAENVGNVGAGLGQPTSATDLLPETADASMPLLARAAVNSMGMEPGPEGKKRLFARYGGQQFEVPEQSDHTPFGADYDTIYQGLLDAGEDPHKAMQYVAQQYKSDQTQKSIASRTADQIDARNKSREDQQEFQALQNKLYRNEPMTAAEREKLARIRASAGSSFKQEGVNERMFGLLDRRAKAVRDTGLFGKLAANDKVVRGIAANLANGTEGLQHKDAQIQLARYFRQAQPTEGEMHLLYDKLGGWTDSFNQFKAKVLRGDLSPEQLRQMRKSARTVMHEHEEDKKRFYQVARSGLGPKSGLDEIPDQAQQAFDMMAAELGIEPGTLPPLYDTEGGVTLGTKQAPKTQKRGTTKSQLDEIESYLDSLGGGGGR